MQPCQSVPLAQRIVKLSRQMLKKAQHNDWAAFQRLEIERQQLMVELFNLPLISQVLPNIAELMQEVLKYDQKSIALGIQAQDNLATKLSGLQQGKRALAAYQRGYC